MEDQKLEREDVEYCFGLVKELIEHLPNEAFPSGSKLAEKKEMADLALKQLEDFFKMLPKIKKNEIDGLFKQLIAPYNCVCDLGSPTIDPPLG